MWLPHPRPRAVCTAVLCDALCCVGVCCPLLTYPSCTVEPQPCPPPATSPRRCQPDPVHLPLFLRPHSLAPIPYFTVPVLPPLFPIPSAPVPYSPAPIPLPLVIYPLFPHLYSPSPIPPTLLYPLAHKCSIPSSVFPHPCYQIPRPYSHVLACCSLFLLGYRPTLTSPGLSPWTTRIV